MYEYYRGSFWDLLPSRGYVWTRQELQLLHDNQIASSKDYVNGKFYFDEQRIAAQLAKIHNCVVSAVNGEAGHVFIVDPQGELLDAWSDPLT
jgi:hypothetical protein